GRTSHEELAWRIVNRREQRRERRVSSGDATDLSHAAGNSPGIRYESASATCAGSTAAEPVSVAIVRATRATRARPRPDSGRRSTAFERSSEADSVRLGV